MWHPFRQKALERKLREQDEFAKGIEQSLAAALATPDKGRQLLMLDKVQQDISTALRVERGMQRIHSSNRRLAGIAAGGGTAFTCLMAVAVLHVPAAWPIVGGALLLSGGGMSGGVALGKRAARQFDERSNAENEPFHARLETARETAATTIDQILAGSMPELAKSPVFYHVLESMPLARTAFTAAAMRGAASDQQAPAVPPKPPEKGLNL